MGASPTANNPWISLADGFVKAAITGGQDVAVGYLTAQVPILGLPVISTFVSWIAGLIANSVYHQAANFVALAVLDVQTNLETSAMGRAVTQLQQAKANGDANAINAANSAFDSAAASLLHSDGSGPVA